MTTLWLGLALGLDAWWGEWRRGHPLVAFGAWVRRLEQWLNRPGRGRRLRGGLALCLAVGPLLALALWLQAWAPTWLLVPLSVLVLYLALGLQSLREHALAVVLPLQAGDLPEARRQVARLVSRDCERMSAEDVARATTESVLENGADAVFASLFWFLVAGLPGVVLHRLVNTLDAMWGYRNDRYGQFGWAAARLDDLLNLLPARLVALTYVCVAAPGRRLGAWRCWHRQAPGWDSPNAGPVMAAGAGALGCRLGGSASYGGERRQRPLLGEGPVADADTPLRALQLIDRGVLLWTLLTLVALLW